MRVLVRPRRQADLEACVIMLRRVHADSGYPVRWPAEPVKWLLPLSPYAWVAEADGQVCGHMVLDAAAEGSVRPSAQDPPLLRLERLFVDPFHRGRGVGDALVHAAEDAAVERNAALALIVLDKDRAAARLYERRGWVHTRSGPAEWVDDRGGRPLVHHYRHGAAPR